MLYVIQNLHWFILFIGALVTFHELGHFLVAKACGVKVEKFSIGFGPKLLSFKRGETEYRIGVLPLGGYVKMLGELPGSYVADDEAKRAFSSQSLWKRSAIVLAGPAFNILLAFVVYLALSTGSRNVGEARVGTVGVAGPAYRAGIRPGDRILQINGQAVSQWSHLPELIGPRAGQTLTLELERQGQKLNVDVVPDGRPEPNMFQEIETRGKIDVSPFYIKPIVAVIDPQSPAAQAGIVTGDNIVEVNGNKIQAWHDVRREVMNTPSGQDIALTVQRDGVEKKILIKPSEPVGLPANLLSSADPENAYTGMVSKESLVAKVDPNTPAARTGLQVGDRLLGLRVDQGEQKGDEISIGAWSIDLAPLRNVRPETRFMLGFQRGRQTFFEQLQIDAKEERDEFKNKRTVYVFGAENDSTTLESYNLQISVSVLEAVPEALARVGDDMTLIVKAVSKMVRGDIPLDQMGGPIMLFVIAEKSAKRGFEYFLFMMAMISVNLGMLNLLPVPVLDGGHLLFFAIEAVQRRPASIRMREVANVMGLALLLLLMVLVFRNDFLRFVLG